MPPLPVVPNVIKLILSSTRADSPVENILHMAYSGAVPDSATLESWLTSDFISPWETLVIAEGGTDCTNVSVEAIDLSSDTGGSAFVANTAQGTRTGDVAPASACVISSWEIDRRYRGGHPRTYWPFGTAGTYETGSAKLWDSGFIADVQTKLETFVAGIQGTTTSGTTFTTLVNVSYVDKNLNPTPPYRRTTPQVDAITSLIARQRICSQRRRLGKVLG